MSNFCTLLGSLVVLISLCFIFSPYICRIAAALLLSWADVHAELKVSFDYYMNKIGANQ